MTKSPLSRRLRALRMGLSTVLAPLLGTSRAGWFIPYRYAPGVTPPARYPVLEDRFDAARPVFQAVLDRIDGYAVDLEAIGATAEMSPPPQPRWSQGWFPRLDAAVAYAMVRQCAPRRIVEVGSGHSTRFMARAIADAGLQTELVAIDPAPRADIARLAARHVPTTVQEADPALFAALAPGDILFIDSSHILMPGTDVDYLFNQVWPALPAGVVVHVHDITLPDGYPQVWDWRGYNEQLGVAPMIAGGGAKLLFSSSFVATRMADALAGTVVAKLPLLDGAFDTSLWIEKN